MRDLHKLDHYRISIPAVVGGDVYDTSHNGAFIIGPLRIIASNRGGWDHVSVSLPDRCPTWAEMDAIKRLFFNPDEIAMQLHVAEADHISIHPYVLHLWRPHSKLKRIPLPPKDFV
jgi:hypothetical protein